VNALALAFGLLTAVPVRRLPRADTRSAGAAILLAPVTTLPILGLLAAAGFLVAHARLPALVAAVLVIGGAALYSRAMHLDGLADTADGLSATGDTTSRLAAMKASDIGPSGVAVLVLVLLLQVSSLTVLLPTSTGTALAAVAWVTSRQSIAWCCRPGVPAATSSGLGAMVAGSVPSVGLAAGAAALLGVTTVLSWIADAAWWTGPLVATAGLLGAAALLQRGVHRFGGVTGDVLGAVVETALTVALVAAVLLDAWVGTGAA
jgi:adenosylcobinamide-GDP ribazoletransferase